MKKSEIQKPFLEMVESIVVSKGFEKLKTKEGYEYKLKTNNGFSLITPFINQYDTIFFISIAFQLRINEVSNILILLNNISDEYKESYPTLSFGIDSFIKVEDKRIKVETPEELAKAINFLGAILKNEGLNFFGTFNNVSDLDRDMNREGRPKDLYTSDREFIGLIAAVLSGNPNSKYWENYYRENLNNVNQYIKNQYEKLVEYLKNNYPDKLRL